MSETLATASTDAPAWRLEWLSPIRCRLILLLFLTLSFLGNLYYLHHSPIDLSGDEAQYWDWSRNLDLSYYSKGPGIAYLIRASCAIFGETMPAVRYPAIVIGAVTSLVVYLLTARLFGSERLALGTVFLFALVPIMIIGSVLITIDPPMFLSWGLATYLATFAIFDQKKWAWPLIGIVLGVGFLIKYVTLVWYIGLFGYLMFEQSPHPDPLPAYRERGMKLMGGALALLISLLFTAPVILWNYQHDWVSFRHVAQQTGTSGGTLSLMNILIFVGGQLGAVGPAITWLMLVAVWAAIRSGDARQRFLLWIGLPLYVICFVGSLRTKIQLNWPAPAYFTLFILTANFIGSRTGSLQTWQRWRGWVWGAVATGLVLIPIARDTSFVLPVFQRVAKAVQPTGDDFDPLARLRGWSQVGNQISAELLQLRDGAFVLCDDYQQTAETAFYVKGQPRTYCAGFYFGKRMSQYDIWSRLDASSPLVGHDAIYLGKGAGIPDTVETAFDHVQRLPFIEIVVNGVQVRRFTIWRCQGFKGMKWPEGASDY